MATTYSLHSDFVPIQISIRLPGIAALEQPFLYTVKTYVPKTLLRKEAKAMLQESVQCGAIAYLIETLGWDESDALQIMTLDTICIEFWGERITGSNA